MSTAYRWGQGRHLLKLTIPKGSHVLAYTGGCPLEAEIMYPHDSKIFIEKSKKMDYWSIDPRLKKCNIEEVTMHYGTLM